MLRRLVSRNLVALMARVIRLEWRVADCERRVAELELRVRREARRPPIMRFVAAATGDFTCGYARLGMWRRRSMTWRSPIGSIRRSTPRNRV